jgi:putative Mn2+ efflux pump MntP
MEWSMVFVVNSILLGVGLAMDAFSVSMANGLNEPDMRVGRMCQIAGTFGGFQIAMPLIGWLCVHTVVQYFRIFETFIPWIALILLAYIGGKMLLEGIRNRDGEAESTAVGFGGLMLQGIATSIDALSVGFAIADYGTQMAAACAVIVGVVTFFLCIGGLLIGKNFGTKLSGKASVLGGVILIAIGLEIFVSGMLG